MSAPLYERYRPTSLDQVIGQPKAVQRIKSIGDPGGQSYWFSGASGTGKTTLAMIVAGMIADPFFIEELDATALTPARLRDVEQTMGLYGGGLGGRAYIINEAHGLRTDTIRQLDTLLERLPNHVVMIFTTTRDGQDELFEDHAIEAAPLLSRCFDLALTTQGLAKLFAVEAKQIAKLEHLDGQPLARYLRLVQSRHNNMRYVLQDIQAGAMKA